MVAYTAGRRTVAAGLSAGDVRALSAGEITRAECERQLSARTRQYAKRQDTWRRRLPRLEAVPADGPAAQVARDIAARLADEPRYD